MYFPHNSHLNHECFKRILNMCHPFAFTLKFVHFMFSLCAHLKFTLVFLHSLFVCKITYKISLEKLALRKNQLRIFIDFILMSCYH